MHLIVVGAGIGGLAAAVALKRSGHVITLIERAPQFGEVGAGVVLGPHAMRALKWLGADGHVRALNNRPNRLSGYDIGSGDHRITFELGATGVELYGADLYTTHRRDLIDALAGQLRDTQVILGRTLTTVEQDEERVRVALDDGTLHHADALVGADGLNSTVRSALFGRTEAKFSGFLAWRTVLPASKLGKTLPIDMSFYIGRGRHVVFYPIRHGTQFYAAFYVPAEEIHREDWSASGDVNDLRDSFSDACEQVRTLASKIDQAFITGIFYRDPLPQWHKGRVVLIGDAAHPVLPTSGSGAGMALEDAVALATTIDRHGEDIETAFHEFQTRRQPRTARLLISSQADLLAYHEQDPIKIAARAAMARGVSRLDPTGHARLQWLYGYDEVAQSALSLDAIERAQACKLTRPEAQRAFAAWQQALGLEDATNGWVSERSAYDKFMEKLCPWPSDVKVERVEQGNVRGYVVTPPGGGTAPGIFHLHGGYFIYGNARGGVAMAARIAKAMGGWAFVPEYRLAPENCSAAVYEDVAAAFDWMSSRSPELVVGAEDAGATLALGLAQTLRDRRKRMPLALYLLSPLVDLTLESASIDAKAAADPWITRMRLVNAVGAFIQGGEPTDPLIAPLCADLQGVPPLRVFAAADEALVDDARKLCRVASGSGVDSVLHEVEDSVHRYALFDYLPETDAFARQIAQDYGQLRARSRPR